MIPDLQSLADEFLASQAFLLSERAAQEDVPVLLHAFIAALPAGVPTIEGFERAFDDHLARLDLPLESKRSAPSLVDAFFSWCASSGAWPPAREWTEWIRLLAPSYLAKFRDDGSVRGTTFRKNYTDVNRNDPCPCGSGKKFKKCCMGLLG